MINLKTVSSQIRESLASIEDVVAPRVNIISKHDGIIINSYSKLSKGIDVTDKSREIREKATAFASKNLGFKVLRSNYTASGFVPKIEKKLKEVKKEEPIIKDEPEIQEEK